MPGTTSNDARHPQVPSTVRVPQQATVGPSVPAWVSLLPHPRRLVALACRCGCTPDDAQDVAQEALLRAGLRPPADPARLGAFLDQTVRRLVVDRHREQHRQDQLTEHLALHPQPDAGPEDQVCDHAEGAWLHTQTAALRPRERAALLARADGRSTAQIAAELGTTVKAVELLMRRGRLALQALTVTACAVSCLSLQGALLGRAPTAHTPHVARTASVLSSRGT